MKVTLLSRELLFKNYDVIFSSKVYERQAVSFAKFKNAVKVIFLAGETEGTPHRACVFVAVALHYFYLTVFSWNNIMAWDIYKTFGQRTILSHIRSKRLHYPRYLAYGYGVPAIVVVVACLAEYTRAVPNVSMGYGGGRGCWIGSPCGSFVFFFVPMLFVTLSNLILYVLTIASIHYVSTVVESTKHKDRGKDDLYIYVKIFCALGFTWIFGILPTVVDGPLEEVFVLCFVVFQSLQGVLLFSVFTANCRVWGLYRNLFGRMKNRWTFMREEKSRLAARSVIRANNLRKESENLPEGKTINPLVPRAQKIKIRNLTAKWLLLS